MYDSLKNIGKNILVSGAILWSSILGAKEAAAQELNQNNYITKVETLDERILGEKVKEEHKKEPPERKLTLSFANPVENFEANANAAYSGNQLLGRINDYLGINAELDKNLPGRIGLTILPILSADMIYTTSHELSHAREGKRHGKYSVKFEPNSLDFAENIIKKFRYEPTEKQFMRESIAGLNQNEFNAQSIFSNTPDKLTFDNGLAFIYAKGHDLLYNELVNTRSEDRIPRDFKNQDLNRTTNDIDNYIYFLNKKGISLSKQDFIKQAIIADVLSMQTWDSISAIGNYLINGERSIAPTHFKLGDIAFTPPLISNYLTENGSFFNMTSTIDPDGKNPLELSIGTDVDFIGGGKVDRLRLGGKLSDLRLTDEDMIFRISPFAYVDTDKSLNGKGYSIGTEIVVPVTKTIELTAKAEYNKNDVINNSVMGKDKGIYVLLGINSKF